MKSNKAKNQAAETGEKSLRENARYEVCGLCALGNVVIEGRNEQEQIALAKKLTGQVKAMDAAKINAAEFAGVDDNTLGELSTALMNELSDSISKGRTLAEQVGLLKQLRYQVEMNDSPEPKTSEETGPTQLVDDAELVLEHAKHFYRNLRRKVYQCLCFLASLEKIDCWLLPTDNQETMKNLKEAYFDCHKQDLADRGPETIKLRQAS